MSESLKHRVLFGVGCAAVVVGMVAYRIFWLRSGNKWEFQPEQKDND